MRSMSKVAQWNYGSTPKRIFSLSDWTRWLDDRCTSLFGLSGAAFEMAYESGDLGNSGAAQDVASVLPLIRRLRRKSEIGEQPR
jgi:hypothetical protein